MSARPALPSIDDELAAPPRRRLDLRRPPAAAAIDDAVVEANSRTLGQRWGASTTVPLPEPEQPPAAVASLRLEIPDYLDRELALAAAKQRVTKAFLVMSALARAGYRIEAADLVPDRRKARQRKAQSGHVSS